MLIDVDYSSVFLSHSLNENTRIESSSGGFTRELLKHVLESGYVDNVVCARTGGEDNPLEPEILVTDDHRQFFNRRACSVYKETKDLIKTLKNLPSNKTFACVMLPCHVGYVRRMGIENIKLIIEILCNYWPKDTLTISYLQSIGVNVNDVKRISYRGDGWPGKSSVWLKDGARLDTPSDKFWSNDRPKFGPGYCQKCCRLSEGGDLVVGDPWNIPGDMGNGETLVKLNNTNVLSLISEMRSKRMISLKFIHPDWFDKSVSTMIKRKNDYARGD